MPDFSFPGDDRFRMLGALRVLTVGDYFEARLTGKSEAWEQSLDGVQLVAESLGLPIKGRDIIPAFEMWDKPSDLLLESTLRRDQCHDYVLDQFGKQAAFHFTVAQLLALVRMLSSIFRHTPSRRVSARRRRLITGQRTIAIHAFCALAETLKAWHENISLEWGGGFARLCSRLARSLDPGRWTRRDFERVYDISGAVVNELMPNWHQIAERLERVKTILHELRRCKPGRVNWRQYEDVCIKALRFLFVPPFRNVTLQVSSADGHERRDAVLPNNQFSGFWCLVREEFDSRHVISEFKNSAAELGKDDLTQLRIYLSKPSIGRFGMLFHRDKTGQSAVQARRNAYEQSRILVLLINDAVLTKLVKAKTYLGTCDWVLESLKARFELDY